ncbi:PEP-CTERM sorting domain-containing protein [Rubrivivax rivuli]|uniref:PEP-CTERM sorting domain-containing protein n=1 Tax=Rubrivivax rivuli TaxID=1862385 RepID=A0A437RB27_9BURK|nr:PEP-CTERM sorting domain-containing protein [Rubrivivax rivuli]RVU43884.1 PEP-CTERM sorting domain-containing protein [Rubrivivax rivuli]
MSLHTPRFTARAWRTAVPKCMLLISLGLAGAWSQASTVVLTTSQAQIRPGADNQGWLSSVSANENAFNDNHITGLFGPGEEYRSFFSFSLQSLTGTVLGARIELRRYQQQGTVNLGFWDTTATAAELSATRDGLFSPGIFEDLGSGTSYGSFQVVQGDGEDILAFELNAQALSALNARLAQPGDGYFSLGAAVQGEGYLFATSNDEPGASGGLLNSPQRLVLRMAESQPVPEPGSLALAVLGLAVAARATRMRSRA